MLTRAIVSSQHLYVLLHILNHIFKKFSSVCSLTFTYPRIKMNLYQSIQITACSFVLLLYTVRIRLFIRAVDCVYSSFPWLLAFLCFINIDDKWRTFWFSSCIRRCRGLSCMNFVHFQKNRCQKTPLNIKYLTLTKVPDILTEQYKVDPQVNGTICSFHDNSWFNRCVYHDEGGLKLKDLCSIINSFFWLNFTNTKNFYFSQFSVYQQVLTWNTNEQPGPPTHKHTYLKLSVSAVCLWNNKSEFNP